MDKAIESSKLVKIENFDINSDYGIYSIEISKSQKEKSDYIHFKAFDKNHISSLVYQKSFNFDALLEISKIFKLCNNIDDALNIILETFKNKEVKISKDDTLNLCFYKLPTNNFNELKIPLEKSKIEDSCMIEKLCESLSLMQDKYKKLEEEVENLKSDNKKLTELLSQKEGHPISETLIDIMQKKFMKSQYLLSRDLSDHLKEFGLKDDFKKEIQNRFELSKARVIYDVKKDGDTLVGFMAKVFGKKNIATFHALHTDENYHSVQLAYLNGKLEFINNYFNFEDNDLFTYGNYQVYEGDYCYTSFKAQNSKLYVKIEFDCIYVIFYENDNINFVIKIRDNFVNNPILYLDEDSDKISNFFEENSEDKVGELFNNSKVLDVYLTELVIYQIED